MAVTIPTYGDRAAYRCTVTLDEVEVVLAFRWHPRAAGWFVSASLADGTALATAYRLAPGGEVRFAADVEGRPPGRLYVTGSGPLTRRQALGTTHGLAYLTGDELAALEAA